MFSFVLPFNPFFVHDTSHGEVNRNISLLLLPAPLVMRSCCAAGRPVPPATSAAPVEPRQIGFTLPGCYWTDLRSCKSRCTGEWVFANGVRPRVGVPGSCPDCGQEDSSKEKTVCGKSWGLPTSIRTR